MVVKGKGQFQVHNSNCRFVSGLTKGSHVLSSHAQTRLHSYIGSHVLSSHAQTRMHSYIGGHVLFPPMVVKGKGPCTIYNWGERERASHLSCQRNFLCLSVPYIVPKLNINSRITKNGHVRKIATPTTFTRWVLLNCMLPSLCNSTYSYVLAHARPIMRCIHLVIFIALTAPVGMHEECSISTTIIEALQHYSYLRLKDHHGFMMINGVTRASEYCYYLLILSFEYLRVFSQSCLTFSERKR